uniref:Calcium-independent phospholipase A2-gamma-like n=1 Tax=Phallusia mammillata TaxID=59560 RepID=A0A6F9DPS1_9ASCI|nr:calcium-independent phospholipase A2-gamma-like [Phallusia mammillata]
MVVATLPCTYVYSFQTLKVYNSCKKPRKCLGSTGHLFTRGSRTHKQSTGRHQVISSIKERLKFNPFQTKNIFASIKTVYLQVKVKCHQRVQSFYLIPVHLSHTRSTMYGAVSHILPSSSKSMWSKIQHPWNLLQAGTVKRKKLTLQNSDTQQGPLVYFSSSQLEKPQNNIENGHNGQTSDDDNCDGGSKDKDSKKLTDKMDYRNSKLEDIDESKVSHSQYDFLIQRIENTPSSEENAGSLLSSVKQFVEMPVNSFFSFISQTNLLDKPENGTASSNDQNPKEEKGLSVQINKNEEESPAPVSLLDSLYKFIPYISTPGNSKGNEKLNEKKLDEAHKEALRIQRQKDRIAQKVEINNRTRQLIQSIRDANSMSTICHNVEDLKNHLLKFPDTRITAVKQNAIREITHIYRTTLDKDILPTLRMTLALLGSVDPPKQRGIRVLCIDGGGCRGILSLEIFRRMMELSGKQIHEMFDYICGVSTGAILAFLLGIKRIPIEDIESIYRQLGSEVFNQSRLVGTGKLMVSHAYYNTETLQKILCTVFGDKLLIETAAHEDAPKCSAVSTLVNRMMLKPYVWRNYSIVPGTRLTHWPGTCRGKLWEALRASSAAPGYFEEFKKHHNIHQDGGLLTNNPTGVALNECSLLWPNSPIQCVVSVGTGRYEPNVGPTSDQFLTLKDKLLKVVDSATSVSEVHTVMYDLLPDGTYFRFNPFIREPLQLDDFEPDKLDMLVEDARDYIDKNDYKFRACVNTLGSGKAMFAR